MGLNVKTNSLFDTCQIKNNLFFIFQETHNFNYDSIKNNITISFFLKRIANVRALSGHIDYIKFCYLDCCIEFFIDISMV